LGPALETFLSAVLPIILVVGLLAYIFRDAFKRFIRYLKAWQLRDEKLEAEESACRNQAMRELGDAPAKEDLQSQNEELKT
jgi:hypothetical protein